MNLKKEFTDKPTKGIFLLVLLFSFNTYAGFLVEPAIKNISGKFSKGNTKGKLSGEVYTLKLGYSGSFFHLGFNFETGNYYYDSSLSINQNTLYKGGGLGTFLGFHFLDRIWLWTGYLNSSLEEKENNNKRYFGQQVEIGLGYRLWNGLLLTYSYYNNYFTQVENDLTGKTESIDETFKTNGNTLSLSYLFIF